MQSRYLIIDPDKVGQEDTLIINQSVESKQEKKKI